ncbi:MAG TPA: cytochrome c3 family protein, partial [Opitutaceae bacterium]|nr:cytochrome c3 family protein [Opitutaceae bacterium]
MIILFGTTVVAGGYVLYEYYHSPYWDRVGIAPLQPVLFSHRHHAGELRIDCRFCHATVETSAFAGMPTTQTCLGCHSQIFTDTAMLQPVMLSASRGQPLRWHRVTTLPDFVFFNHSIHIAKGVACASCHGSVGDM